MNKETQEQFDEIKYLLNKIVESELKVFDNITDSNDRTIKIIKDKLSTDSRILKSFKVCLDENRKDNNRNKLYIGALTIYLMFVTFLLLKLL